MNDTKSIENMTFEDALEELTALVSKLDSDQANLDDAISSFERGVELKNLCEKKLQNAKLRVEKIVEASGNKVEVEEFKE